MVLTPRGYSTGCASPRHKSQFLTVPYRAEQPAGPMRGTPPRLPGPGRRAGIDEVAQLDFAES